MDKRTRVILIASLTANLFLGGAVIGGVIAGSRMLERHDNRRGERGGMLTAFSSIPEDRRGEIRRTLRGDAEAARPQLEAARAARRRVAELIAAPDYDPTAVASAMALAREADGRARTLIDDGMAKRLAQLTPEERKIFSTVMNRGPRGDRGQRGPGGPGGRRGPPPPEGPPPPP